MPALLQYFGRKLWKVALDAKNYNKVLEILQLNIYLINEKGFMLAINLN